jgi:hypothetical protein
MESTTRRRWQPRDVELQWEPERTLPLKASITLVKGDLMGIAKVINPVAP